MATVNKDWHTWAAPGPGSVRMWKSRGLMKAPMSCFPLWPGISPKKALMEKVKQPII